MPSCSEFEVPQPDNKDEALLSRVDALACEMQANGRERDGPVRTVLGFVGDRWSSLIVLVLETGVWRHADLRRVLSALSDEGAISQRVMTLKLRALEREGLVLRHVSDDVPPRVAYGLSPLGRELAGQLRQMIDWVSTQSEAVIASRREFDANNL